MFIKKIKIINFSYIIKSIIPEINYEILQL